MDQCAACGAKVDRDAKVCPDCGAALLGSTASFPPIVGERAPEPVLGAVAGPVLVVSKGPQVGERFWVDRPRLAIGRDPASDIFLNDITVSRDHAVVELAEGVVSIRDAGSLNGTYVNGTLVDQAVLNVGDLVQIGTFQMVFADTTGA